MFKTKSGKWVKVSERPPTKEGVYQVKRVYTNDIEDAEYTTLGFNNYQGYAVEEWFEEEDYFLNKCEQLKEQSFEGWSKEAVKGYNTCMTTLISIYKAEPKYEENSDDEIKELIEAWDSLEGNKRYTGKEIERWLIDKMAPVINKIRAKLKT